MLCRQVLSFLKNVLLFLFDRLYKEWEYMLGNGQSNSDEKASERGDLFAKQLIENIIHDRVELDGKATMSFGIASIVLGKAHLTGLSSLHRICSLTEAGDRLFINMNLGATPLTYQRQIVFRLGNFVRKTAVIVSLIDIKVSVDFSIEKETGRNGSLLNFAISGLNGFKLNVNGFGFFDWAINLFVSFWTLILRRIFRNLFENELEQYIQKRLPKYQFPVEKTSYRNETKINNHKLVQNNEESLSELLYMKQSNETPNGSGMSPIGESSANGQNSEEFGSERDFGSDSEITKCLPETNKWFSEMDKFHLPPQSKDICSESLNENSCNEVSKDKAVEKCDLVSELSNKTRELSRSYELMVKKLDLIYHISNSFSKEIASTKCLEVLNEDFREESTNSASSSSAKGFENESFTICERHSKINKSKSKDFSQMLQDSNRDQLESENENRGQSDIEALISYIQGSYCKKDDENAFGTRINLPARVTNCDLSPSRKVESSEIDENTLEPSSIETGKLLSRIQDIQKERRKAQIDYLEKMFNGKSKERTEGSNKNQHVSVESCNHCTSPEENFSKQNLDSKLYCTDMFQNESLISCTINEFEKHPDFVIEDPEFVKSYRTEKLSRNQGVKVPEIQCISNPEDKADSRNLFKSIISDLKQQKMIRDENSFELDADTEMVSTSLQLGEKHEYEANEKIPFKCDKFHTGEDLKDSQLQSDEGYGVDNSSDSEESPDSSLLKSFFVPFSPFPIVPFDFPAQSSDLCSRSFESPTKVECGRKVDHISVNSFNVPEISISANIEGELDSTNHKTNFRPQESSLLEELESWSERDTECTDSKAGILSITGLNLNANLNKNNLEETSDVKSLPNLQEEIIAVIRKMVSDVTLEPNSEGSVHSGSTPISSNKNRECGTNKSICNELNQFQRKDLKSDLGVISLLEDSPTSSVTEYSTLEYTDSNDCSDWSTETSSESEDEPKREM